MQEKEGRRFIIGQGRCARKHTLPLPLGLVLFFRLHLPMGERDKRVSIVASSPPVLPFARIATARYFFVESCLSFLAAVDTPERLAGIARAAPAEHREDVFLLNRRDY